MSFKIWGLADLAKYTETMPLTPIDYNHVEANDGSDVNNHITFQRTQRNLYENELETYAFLEKLARSTNDTTGIFKGSFENEFNFNSTNDIVLSNIGGDYEVTKVKTIADVAGSLGGKYFNINTSNGLLFYVWFDVDAGSSDPAPGGRVGIKVDISSGDNAEDVAFALRDAVDANVNYNATIPAISDEVIIVNTLPGTCVDTVDVDTTFTITTETQGANQYKYYTRLKPGIAYLNGVIVSVKPQTHITERILIKIFNLEDWAPGGENITINYDYTNDEYNAVLKKKDTSDALQTYTFNNSGANYNTGIDLLQAIYDHPVFHNAMENAIGGDLTKILLEPIAEITSTGVKFWSINNDGSIGFGASGDFDLWSFNVTTYDTATPDIVVGTPNDTRLFFQNFNDFKNNIYFNVPKTWSTDTTETLAADQTKQFDPASIGVDWTEVTDGSSFITILRQHDGLTYASGSASFGWAEGLINQYDPFGVVPGTESDKFFVNKDLLVQWGPNVGDWGKFSTIATAALTGINTVDTVNNLPIPPSGGDGSAYFVKDINQFYRYSSSIAGWIPVSDPHKQLWGTVGTMLGTQSTDAPTNTIFQFSGLWWKTDGSNIQVFKNGLFQLMGSSYDYTITDHNTITLVNACLDTDKITVRIAEGGEEWYPDRVNYVAGTASGAYTGDLSEFSVFFQLVQDRVDVFVNGALQKDSVFTDTMTETVGGNTDRIIDNTKTFTTANIGNYILVKNVTLLDNEYEIRRVVSVPNSTTLVLDSVLPQNTTVGDTYSLYEDYDYFVDEYGESGSGSGVYDRIMFSNPQTAGSFIEIRDRATMVGSLDLNNKGTVFPSSPIFGYKFYRTDLDAWFTWNGTSWS